MAKSSTKTVRYGSFLTIAILLTVAGIVLAFFSVSASRRDVGQTATALIGGADAREEGLALQVGNYRIRAADPLFATGPDSATSDAFKNQCDRTNKVDLIPVIVEPGGTECLAASETHDFDDGRLDITVQQIDVGDFSRLDASGKSISLIAVSRVSATIQKTNGELAQEVGILVLLGLGPALLVGVLIARMQDSLPPREEAPRTGPVDRSNLNGVFSAYSGQEAPQAQAAIPANGPATNLDRDVGGVDVHADGRVLEGHRVEIYATKRGARIRLRPR